MVATVVGVDVEVVVGEVVVAAVDDVDGLVVVVDDVVEPAVVEVVDEVVVVVVLVLVVRIDSVVTVGFVVLVVVVVLVLDGFDVVGCCVVVVAFAVEVVPAPAPAEVVVVDRCDGTVVVGFGYDESTGASPGSSGVEPFSQAMPSLSRSRLSR